ncbi:MAG: CDP-diacylglycerol--glycerol-3-phosphate 3-phosphatidyltransferase [Pseudomonadota bacterium]
MKKQIPNILTYSRILVIPLLVLIFIYSRNDVSDWLCASLFLYASITDFFDGYLARAWHANSNIGKFLDPIADKLLIASCLMLLVSSGRAHILPSLAILCREILVSGLREFLADLNISVPVSTLAKYKTATQMIAIFLLLLGSSFPLLQEVGNYLLWTAALLTLFTGYAYLRTGLKHLANN